MAGPYPSGHPDPQTAAIIAVLQRWHDGIEEGSAYHWFPDPNYTWRNQKDEEQRVREVFAAIEARFKLEVPRVVKPDGLGLADAGPDYESLAYPQRLAMCQELDAVLKVFEAARADYSDVTIADIAYG